jgi:hypothetical protein
MHDEAPLAMGFSEEIVVKPYSNISYDNYYGRTVTAEVEGSSPFQVAIKSLTSQHLQRPPLCGGYVNAGVPLLPPPVVPPFFFDRFHPCSVPLDWVIAKN